MSTPGEARRLYELKRRLHEAAVGAQNGADNVARATQVLARDAHDHFSRAIEELAQEETIAPGELEERHDRVRDLARKLDAARAAAQAAAGAAEAQGAITRARYIESEQMKRWEELNQEDARAALERQERIREDELGASRPCK